jgi:hypothetical protein
MAGLYDSTEERLCKAIELLGKSQARIAAAAEKQLVISESMLNTQKTLAKGSAALEKELTGSVTPNKRVGKVAVRKRS